MNQVPMPEMNVTNGPVRPTQSAISEVGECRSYPFPPPCVQHIAVRDNHTLEVPSQNSVD